LKQRIIPPDLAQIHVASHPRNPLLAGLLRDLPGYMERVGSGIRLMVIATRQLDLPPPEFLEQHEVVVIFRNGMAPQMEVTAQLNPR